MTEVYLAANALDHSFFDLLLTLTLIVNSRVQCRLMGS